MPAKSQKKSEQILLMVTPETFNEIKSIAAAEDRPLGYVGRELMIRGLALYRVDGKLRDDSNGESKIVATLAPGSLEEARRLYEQNVAALQETRVSKREKLPPVNETQLDLNAEERAERDDNKVSTPRKRAGRR